jgi:hypothetical protein
MLIRIRLDELLQIDAFKKIRKVFLAAFQAFKVGFKIGLSP